MRIALTTWSGRGVGGTETYIGRIIAQLSNRGHEIALCYERDVPADRQPIPRPSGAPAWGADTLGEDGALAALCRWKPDVIYAHGLLSPALERRTLDAAPGVFFAHGYFGTCITAQKTQRFPVITPCDRSFGPACLALFYPRRCGGLNPLTMARDYQRQARRLEMLRRYRAVLTATEHMKREFLRNGAAGGCVFNCSYSSRGGADVGRPAVTHTRAAAAARNRLLFVGRMDRLKGGRELLRAVDIVQGQLREPLSLVFAGDGPERASWEDLARRLRRPGLTIEFAGWVAAENLPELLDGCDAVVMPSLWPEPYGLVGPEANRRGVPVVAYASGGIPEWLQEGINGCLAPADPPTIAGLADAIVRCLHSLSASSALKDGALRLSDASCDEAHLSGLEEVLAQAASGGVITGPGGAA